MLFNQVAEFLRGLGTQWPAQKIGVAVSGGADSVVLLHVLHRLRSEFAFELTVLHVNHGLRGAESEADETFVRALARQLGLIIIVERAPAPETGVEARAREIRREFYRRAIRDHGLHKIALGHTRSDQAETVLFRLLRGSGLTGLAGMRAATTDNLIRPLLSFSRTDVREWATAQGIEWRDDYSNLDIAFTRNRLRLETIPALTRTYNPNLEALLAQSAELAQSEEDYWASHIEHLFANLAQQTPLGVQFDVEALLKLHKAVRRRLIRHAISTLRGSLLAIEFEHIESVAALCASQEGHNRVIIPGVDAIRSFGQLLFSPLGLRGGQDRDYHIDLPLGFERELPYRAGIIAANWLKSDDPRIVCANFKKEQDQNIEICDWDGDLLAPSGQPSLCVRNWRPGDVFERAGHHSEEKIKTLFQSAKVLLWERKHWPVVLSGEKIAWTRQFGGAASLIATAASRRVIRLTYRRI